MMGWYHDADGSGWILMVLVMVAVWAVIAWIVVQIVRPDRPQDSAVPDARQILDERLARGEIDVEEFRERLAALERPTH